MADRKYRAGDSIEDICRVCKIDRMHTIIVTDTEGRPLRVSCGYCSSEHNYRGGPASARAESSARYGETTVARAERGASSGGPAKTGHPFPLVSARERTGPTMTVDGGDLEMLLRRVIREETGITPVAPAEKWRGGTLAIRPANVSLQEKTWPIETFFHKVVMVRNRLRTLEQQINATEMPEDVKVKLQSYITGCYGTLTSFNVLLAGEDDQFKGSSSD